MKHSYFFLPLGLLLSLSACKKSDTDPNGLPKATQEGKGTAGWLLDGHAWVPAKSSISTGRPVYGSWERTKGGHSLELSFSQVSRQDDWGINFFLPDIRQPGTFILNQVPAITSGLNNAGFGLFNSQRPAPAITYYTGPNALGQLNITRFDTINNIVSGTFEMTPREDGGGPTTVAITQGRFDLHFDR